METTRRSDEILSIPQEIRERFLIGLQKVSGLSDGASFKKIFGIADLSQFKNDGLLPEKWIDIALKKEDGVEFLAGYEKLSKKTSSAKETSLDSDKKRTRVQKKSEHELVPKNRASKVLDCIKDVLGITTDSKLSELFDINSGMITLMRQGKTRLHISHIESIVETSGLDRNDLFENIGIKDLIGNTQEVEPLVVDFNNQKKFSGNTESTKDAQSRKMTDCLDSTEIQIPLYQKFSNSNTVEPFKAVFGISNTPEILSGKIKGATVGMFPNWPNREEEEIEILSEKTASSQEDLPVDDLIKIDQTIQLGLLAAGKAPLEHQKGFFLGYLEAKLDNHIQTLSRDGKKVYFKNKRFRSEFSMEHLPFV